MIGVRSRTRSTTWTRHPLRRLLRQPRYLLTVPVAVLSALIAFSVIGRAVSNPPDGYLILSPFQIRYVGPGTAFPPVDWGNQGPTTSNPSTCGTFGSPPAGYQWVSLSGTGGVFDCGLKPVAPNTLTVPIAPRLTTLAAGVGLNS